MNIKTSVFWDDEAIICQVTAGKFGILQQVSKPTSQIQI